MFIQSRVRAVEASHITLPLKSAAEELFIKSRIGAVEATILQHITLPLRAVADGLFMTKIER